MTGNRRSGLKRRVIRAGSWHVIKRALKLVPVVGSIFAVGLAGYEIKKKGLIPGMAHVGLDVVPIIGGTKSVVEIFTGDLIPDKEELPEVTEPATLVQSGAGVNQG